jgi:zinc protease
VIFAGHVAPPKANPNEIAIESANDILGGTFTARINMNLREDKGWTYGAGSLVWAAQGPRPFLIWSRGVQGDKTADAMAEIHAEVMGITGDAPPTEDELAKVIDQNTLTLPGRWETADAVGNSIADIVRYGLAEDYWSTYADQVRGQTLEEVSEAAIDLLHPDRIVWVVVGDRSVVEESIQALGYGEVQYLDADGKEVAGG